MVVTKDEVLAALLPDEPNYAAAATIGGDALPHLAEIANGADPLLRAKAVYLAGRIGGKAALALVEDCATKGPRRGIAAAAALRHRPATTEWDVLERLLSDGDPTVVKAALESIRRRLRLHARVIAAVTRLQGTTIDPIVKKSADRLLEELGLGRRPTRGRKAEVET